MREIVMDMVDEMLDAEGDVKIGYLSFSRSQILKEMDPVAYNEELSAMADSLISDLQSDIDSLDPEVDAEEIEEIQERIDMLESVSL